LTRLARFHLAALVSLFLGVPAAEARADWLLTPFVGTTFGAETTLLDLGGGADVAHWTFGITGALLSDQIFGVEADLAWVPGFFEGEDQQDLVRESRVTTLFGNVIVAVPLAVTRESLRPYVIGGLGLVHLSRNDLVPLDDGGNSSLGLQLGGGALGFINDRTGLRFDLRQIRTVGHARNELTGEPGTRLSFWRASVGVSVRF
jgi:hypothetical protein